MIVGPVNAINEWKIHGILQNLESPVGFESHPLRQFLVSFPRTSRSNGEVYVGLRLPRSNVQFDSTVSSSRRCSPGFCDL